MDQARVSTAQRDEALRRLSAAEEEVRHHSAGLRNLQTVLEQFQQGTTKPSPLHLDYILTLALISRQGT